MRSCDASYMKFDKAAKLIENVKDLTFIKNKHFSGFGGLVGKSWKISFFQTGSGELAVSVRGTDNIENIFGDVGHAIKEPVKLLRKIEKEILKVEQKLGISLGTLAGQSEGGYFVDRLFRNNSSLERVTLNAPDVHKGHNRWHFRLHGCPISKGFISDRKNYYTLGESIKEWPDKILLTRWKYHKLKYFEQFCGQEWSEIVPDHFIVEKDRQNTVFQNPHCIIDDEFNKISLFDGVGSTFSFYFSTTALFSYFLGNTEASTKERVKTSLVNGLEIGTVAGAGKVIENYAHREEWLSVETNVVPMVIAGYSLVKNIVTFSPPPLPKSFSNIQKSSLVGELSLDELDLFRLYAGLSSAQITALEKYLYSCSKEQLFELDRLQRQDKVGFLQLVNNFV